jgi:NAD(P)-dependent dehydrogenase (short-subunit alcohol dehydrogenase family)
MSMQGQRVVIVGGTSGIGLAAAKAFIAESAHVVIASRSASKLAEAKQSLGGRAEGYELDFRDTAKSAELFGQIGTINHLVVTAGEATMGPFSDLPLDQAKAAFESKFWGQYVVVKSALPYLHKSGSITLTSGVYGRRPSKGASTLAAINSAIEGLVRGLAVDLAPIRINAVSPGIVETPAYAGIPEQNRKAMFEGMAAQLPVGRIAQPEDIGETYVYLAKNGFTTGTTVIIDGGAHLV